jgi:hypothetical protein
MSDCSLAEQLDRMRERAVPVIGAGLALGCGAPSSAELATELAQAGGLDASGDLDLYEVANELEQRRNTRWVQDQVAEVTLARELVPTPVMMAITLINRGLVATTNYDDAIEKAARAHGLRPKTLVPADLPQVLEGAGEAELLVLHLHGTVDRPETIVLTDSTYEAALDDEALQVAVRVLAAGNSLVFLGHRLADNEVHLRRDVKRAVELFGPGGHLLLHAEGQMADPSAFEAATGVRPVAYPDPDGDHRLLVSFARRLGVSPLSTPNAIVPPVTTPVEKAYEPMPVAPAGEVDTDQQRQVWRYGWLVKREAPPTTDDISSSPLLLVGRPGTGKTQALLHRAQHDPRAVFVRLGSVNAPLPGQESVDVLVAWVRQAGGSFHDLPAVTRTTLLEDAYDFLLDGLDEHTAGSRRDLIEAVGTMASTMPQHRWVVASRPLPELRADGLTSFDAYELAPSREWAARYAKQHGIDEAELQRQVEAAPALAELLDVPLFVAATVDLMKSGRPVPTSPLELLLSYASSALNNEETRLGADPAAVDSWLDRLALAMLCAGTDAATAQDAANELLRGALPPTITTDLLVARVLLVEAGGDLRFPVRAIRDARAVRELRRLSPDAEVFERFGVVRLADQIHLRPDWQYATDLLASAGFDWETRIGQVEPLTSARAALAEPGQQERLEAARTIVDWYRAHRILIPRELEGQIRDDLDALRLLADHPQIEALVPDLVQDLADPEPVKRANGVTVLSAFNAMDQLQQRTSALLRDDDSVVRRRTAVAVMEHDLASFATELVELAITDSDDLGKRTLAIAGIQVADDATVGTLVLRLSSRLRRDTQLTIDNRMTRSQQLATISAAPTVDRDWLKHLASQEPVDWAPGDVEALARLWRTAERHYVENAVSRVMEQHPIEALRGAFNAGLDRAFLLDLLPVLEVAAPNELDQLAQQFGSGAQELVQDFRAFATRTNGPRQVQPAPPPFDLAGAVAEGSLDAILSNHVPVEAIASLKGTELAELVALVDQVWNDPATGASPLTRIRRLERGRWGGGAYGDFELATLAVKTGRSLTEDEWFTAVDLTPHDRDDQASLRAAFQPAWEARVVAELPAMDDDAVESLVRTLSISLTRDLAEAVATRAFGTNNHNLHEVAANNIAESGHLDLLATLAADNGSNPAIDRVLVAHGDADAEARLLTDFEKREYPKLEHWGSDSTWIDRLNAPSSAHAIETALQAMLRRGDEVHDLSPMFGALNRCAGDDAARAYDSMIEDASIPSAPFLWYRKQELIAAHPPELATVAQTADAIYKTQHDAAQ